MVGLYVAWKLSLALVYRGEGYDPVTDPSDAECDDCPLVVVLDGIGYFLGSLLACLVIAVLVWFALRRSGWLEARRDETRTWHRAYLPAAVEYLLREGPANGPDRRPSHSRLLDDFPRAGVRPDSV